MANAAWILLIFGILSIWAYTAYRARQSLRQYQAENRRLREALAGIESGGGRRLDRFMAAVNEAILRLDLDGTVLAANAPARKIFSIASDASFPLAISSLYREPDWNEALLQGLAHLPQSANLPYMHLGNRVLAPRLSPLGSAESGFDGEFVGNRERNGQALLLCLDVTGQYRLERQRRTFLSNLMHDLKTPLTSLLGYARSLSSFGSDPAFVEEASQVIADEARHVNRLLDSLLTLDQIEFARRDKQASSDARDVIRTVVEMLQPQLVAKGSRIHLDAAEKLPRLAMASSDFERVMTNLLENAIRYGAAAGRIDVRLGYAGDQVMIAVEDDGPGVPEKEIPRLTERFYRVDKARARKEGGHGLGLAIVQELVGMYDGRMHIANIEPHGLKVELHLPRSA